MTFSCEFCKPGGKLRWFKNRQEIFHGFKIHFESDGPIHKITINKLNPDDEAKYTCKVNDIETFAHLTVTPAVPIFAFIKPLTPKMEVFRTKSTLLECFVNHETCVPKW